MQNQEILQQAADQARGLAIDAIHACSSGHLGLPLGAAEVGAVLFGKDLQIDPSDDQWLNRDRFVLSAGHGSMFLYGWLHLAGYDLPLEEVKNFRQLHSKTPGHPEFGETPGVECTTGPLGQGVGNAVGMAIASKMLDFPEPFGPVMAVNPRPKGMRTSPLNDLKSTITSSLRYIPSLRSKLDLRPVITNEGT